MVENTEARAPEGAIVEWWDRNYGLLVGGVSNVPERRRVGRVSHYRPDGRAVVYDHDNIRAVVAAGDLTVIADAADAGWGSLACETGPARSRT